MKPYAFLAFVVAIVGFISTITAIESPRKPNREQDKIYVLPRVEDMPTVANPLHL